MQSQQQQSSTGIARACTATFSGTSTSSSGAPGYRRRMRVSGLLSGAFALHVLLTARCMPLHEGRGLVKHKEPPGLSQIPHSLSEKWRDRVPHPQDTFKPQALSKDEPQLNTHLRNSSGGAGPPRCGVPDYPDQREVHLSRHPRQKRFVIFGGRWPKTVLTYKIQRFPWQMRKDKVRQVLWEALKIWSDVTPLTFTEVIEQEADIVIDFARYWHGDNLPFDGPGGILAHAFFPRTHREGDIHFDYDESWTVGNDLVTATQLLNEKVSWHYADAYIITTVPM